MTIEDATQTLKKHAHQELTKAASDFLADLLSEEFNIEDEQILSALLNNGWIQDSIDYHTGRTMDRGYSEGRLGARCQFLIEGWEIEGKENLTSVILSFMPEAAIREYAEKHPDSEAAETRLEEIEFAKLPQEEQDKLTKEVQAAAEAAAEEKRIERLPLLPGLLTSAQERLANAKSELARAISTGRSGFSQHQTHIVQLRQAEVDTLIKEISKSL